MRRGSVGHRCQNKNSRTRGYEWRYVPEAFTEDFGGIEKSQLSWELDTDQEGSTFGARRGQTNLRATGAARDVGGGDGKDSIERLCLSPYVETFNSKVIKVFIPELRSRISFSCFGIPMFNVYMLWTFYVRFAYPYHGYGTLRMNNFSHEM